MNKSAIIGASVHNASLALQNTSVFAHLSPASRRQIGLERLRNVALQRVLPSVPADGINWVATVFPHLSLIPPAPRHIQLWEWAESIERGIRPPPFVAIWPRGSGKSTTAELASTYLAATRRRSYIWYVSATQALADMHVESIGALIESDAFGTYYPKMSERALGKFGNIRGWRRNRLRCGNGAVFDALGLDVGARGTKVEEQRPDLIIFDDIDELFLSTDVINKRIRTITNSVMPAGSRDTAILCIQNLVALNGFFGRMANGTADYLYDRIMSGPHPAITDMVVEQREGRYVIVSGTPTWDGQDLATCQSQIDAWGYTAFCREAQHDIKNDNGLFGDVDFQHCKRDGLPELLRTVVVVDPAVTSTDQSDCHGIAVSALGADDKVYNLWSFEEVVTPKISLKTAVAKAIEYGSREVWVEVNQGGSLWKTLYDNVVADMVKAGELSSFDIAPEFNEIKVTSAIGGKTERASTLLGDYERGAVVNVIGTHVLLEAALTRFPIEKPYDLVDATVHAHRLLREGYTKVFM